MVRQNARSHAGRYLIAIIAPAVVAVVMQLTWPFFEQSASAPFLLTVMICAWFGGLGPGLLSVLISFLVADYFFIQPYFALWPPRHSDLVFLVTHVTVGSFISVLSEAMHRAKRHAESSLEFIRQSEQQLQTVIENLTEGLVISDLEGNLLHWNHAGLEMHGFTTLEEGRRPLPEFANIFELSTLDGGVLSVDSGHCPASIAASTCVILKPVSAALS